MDLIHFRMVMPPELTQPAVDLLTAHDRVLNLVVVRSAHVPGGDTLECDVMQGAANGVLGDLRKLGVDRTGSIAVDGVDMVVVAFLAGVVGIVSLTEGRGSALLGVFISVTTIPAASDIAVSLAFADWHEAWGSLVQLLLNVVVLVVVGVFTLRLQRRMWHRATRRATAGP